MYSVMLVSAVQQVSQLYILIYPLSLDDLSV